MEVLGHARAARRPRGHTSRQQHAAGLVDVIDGAAVLPPTMPPAFVERFLEVGLRRLYPKGSVLLGQAHTARHLALVRSGYVKEEHLLADGRRLICAIKGPGELVGDVPTSGWFPTTAAGVALSRVETVVVDTSTLTSWVNESTTASAQLLDYLAARLQTVREEWIALASCSAEERIFRRVLELAERWGEPDEGHIRLSPAISQEELACWAGVSHQAAVKALALLRRHGIVETGRRQVTVLDVDRLRARVTCGLAS